MVSACINLYMLYKLLCQGLQPSAASSHFRVDLPSWDFPARTTWCWSWRTQLLQPYTRTEPPAASRQLSIAMSKTDCWHVLRRIAHGMDGKENMHVLESVQPSLLMLLSNYAAWQLLIEMIWQVFTWPCHLQLCKTHKVSGLWRTTFWLLQHIDWSWQRTFAVLIYLSLLVEPLGHGKRFSNWSGFVSLEHTNCIWAWFSWFWSA